jgi:hypothetical protein
LHQPLARARLTAGLLQQWQQRNLTASLPLALRQFEDAGNLDNVRLAIEVGRAAQKNAAGAPGAARPSCPGSGHHIHRPVRSGSLFCLRGSCYRDPVSAVGQPRRRADARLDAPGQC